VLENFRQTIYKGLLKIIAKMGISVMGSYRGAQIFEAVGVADEIITDCFPGTPSRIGGIGYAELTADLLSRHALAFGNAAAAPLEDHGQYRYRKQAETHAWSPDALRALQKFRKTGSAEDYADYAKASTDRPAVALRDLLTFRHVRPPVAIDEVEAGADIRRRFTTAAMSLGALSPETHATLAIAMNRIGGKSNSGEGGEDAARFVPDANGDLANSAIKQIASARFGVTPAYLMSARELEIKMAQGSKPGEGGQLPGHKVSPFIAHLRKAVPGVTLISPPPHHDIYSIEDLAQLIYDLKEVNPAAHICVKLVAEAGVGTIAAGVVKAFADVILISGDVGGTGASPWSSIKSAGSPWELGLAEVQQVLLLNGLRERVRLRTDGGLRTGRDIVVAAMLGAEEYNFGTAALIAVGCKYVRQCHLNTCPVGIATQREDLRLKYDGTPEQIVAFFDAVSEEVRTIIASLGFRSLGEVVGRADLLEQVAHPDHPKANLLRLDALLARPDERNSLRYNTFPRNGVVPRSLNDTIAEAAEEAIRSGAKLELHLPIQNTDRTIGARLAGRIALSHGDAGLADDTITLHLTGQAGQSFGAFITITPGVGPTPESEQVVAGNTCLYGATGGKLFIRGSAGERFCVRNSGATAVVEGVGEHGCEYMTGGVAVILGETGRNFGAGMTGGVAFVYDESAQFERRCNRELIALSRLDSQADDAQLRALLEEHAAHTGSLRAKALLADWPTASAAFWKVAPRTA
jgi:glutamate synthase (NADPH/NADH) large chain/glutamate synthase (ferredoxin)